MEALQACASRPPARRLLGLRRSGQAERGWSDTRMQGRHTGSSAWRCEGAKAMKCRGDPIAEGVPSFVDSRVPWRASDRPEWIDHWYR